LVYSVSLGLHKLLHSSSGLQSCFTASWTWHWTR